MSKHRRLHWIYIIALITIAWAVGGYLWIDSQSYKAEDGQRLVTRANARKIAVGLFSYASDNNGLFPPNLSSHEAQVKSLKGYVSENDFISANPRGSRLMVNKEIAGLSLKEVVLFEFDLVSESKAWSDGLKVSFPALGSPSFGH